MPIKLPDPGARFTVAYPFVRDHYSSFDGEDYALLPTWKPGVRHEWISPEDTAPVADGEGAMTLIVVHTFKPGRFPWRICFTRQFITPDGGQFGKSKLHIVTLEKFRRISASFQHPYAIDAPDPNANRPVQSSHEFLERELAAVK